MLTKNIETMKIEVTKHLAADAVMQGEYWRGSHNDVGGKGCFIGCLTHSRRASAVTDKFGLPEPLVKICKAIFEGLPIDDAKLFFEQTPEAIGRDGKDLSLTHWAFLKQTLQNLPTVDAEIQAVIDPIIQGIGELADGGDWDAGVARDAARAARATGATWVAARAAGAAAVVAARAAEVAAGATLAAAGVAAWAARDAAGAAAWAARDAAREAAWAAREAAREAARAKYWQHQSQVMLKLLQDAK